MVPSLHYVCNTSSRSLNITSNHSPNPGIYSLQRFTIGMPEFSSWVHGGSITKGLIFSSQEVLRGVVSLGGYCFYLNSLWFHQSCAYQYSFHPEHKLWSLAFRITYLRSHNSLRLPTITVINNGLSLPFSLLKTSLNRLQLLPFILSRW